jgi:glucosamine kinase
MIADTVLDALEKASSELPVAELVVGAAGTGLEANRIALRVALAEQGIATNLTVTSDAAIALESAFPNGAGIVLIAGTGSIAYARNSLGEVSRVGGLGWRFGDEGSGYSLGRAAIATVLRAREHRAAGTALTKVLRAAMDAASDNDLNGWIERTNVAEVARLAGVVCQAADGGDEVAAELVREAARSLADHVTALALGLEDSDDVRVALHGGLIASDSAVRRSLVAELASRTPAPMVTDVRVDPASGALLLATRASDR